MESEFKNIAEQSFNSTTVQLILDYPHVPNVYYEFQFHNGTINTFTGAKVDELLTGFNSTTVQLILP